MKDQNQTPAGHPAARPPQRESNDLGIKMIRAKRGRAGRLAAMLGLRHQTVCAWQQVPLEYVFIVAGFLHTAPERLRPDFFKDDPLRRGNTLHQEHELIWKNREAYRTNLDALAVISTMIGRPVDEKTLKKCFGVSGRPRGRVGRVYRVLTKEQPHG